MADKDKLLKEADIIPGRNGGNTITTSAGKSFISTVIAKLPFSTAIIDNITALNPKYEVFADLASDRTTRVNQQSIFRNDLEQENGLGGMFSDKNFQQFMYCNLDLDKVKRLNDYRKMSGYSTLADCLDEICDELFVEDKDGNIVNLNLDEETYSKMIREEIQKEWKKFVDLFEFKERGWSWAHQLLIDGEVFFENVISEEHPEYGIIGVLNIPAEIINPFYHNVQNDLIEGFALRRPHIDKRSQKMDKEELIVFQKKQLTYIHSGLWNEDRTMRLPYIENARRAYKQLSLIEDSIVIYRLVRAPERLAFHVDVGNMPPPKAEAYIKRLMQQYWAKKTYDTTTGRVTNVYDPQSMLDSYWFPKRQGTEGTRIERLEGGHNLGQLDDLLYFLRQLYKSMKVPVGRLNPEDTLKDGEGMTREELRFAKFLMRIQRQIALGMKESFITHLKLRNMWDAFHIKSKDLLINFNEPTMYLAMKQQQLFDLKYNNFNNLCQNEGISNSYAQKKYLDMSDDDMAANREWRRKDAALQWELEQILASGPNWKDQLQAMQDVQAGMEASGAGGGGGTPPEFGPSPETPEGETPPETGEGTEAGGRRVEPAVTAPGPTQTGGAQAAVPSGGGSALPTPPPTK